MGAYVLVQALVSRSIFLIHSLCIIAYTAVTKGNRVYWSLTVIELTVILETVYRVLRRRGKETKWFSPCVLCYLLCCVPCFWILELNRLDEYHTSIAVVNATSIDEHVQLIEISGLTLPIQLSPDIWLEVLKQTLLLVILVVRWLLPRGRMSRDSLSQLLFVYFAIASDIMELFELFEEEQVIQSVELTFIVLSVWTLSLVQFTIILTMVSNPRQHRAGAQTSGLNTKLTSSDIWGLFVSLFTMDIPFLCVRLYVVIELEVMTYSILFFLVKNCLVIILAIYRFSVLFICKSAGATKQARAKSPWETDPELIWMANRPNQGIVTERRYSLQRKGSQRSLLTYQTSATSNSSRN